MGAKAKFQKALDYECLSAESLFNDYHAEPIRSVLYRSAASLALICEEYREAERLIATALCGDPPDEIANELRVLLQQVYSHLIQSTLQPFLPHESHTPTFAS